MPSDRLSGLDASFLHVEDRAAHMHVAAALVFAGEAPRYEDFLDFVQARMHLVPRYRQLVKGDPVGLGRPHWVDDERFDLRYHVRATGLPRPGGEEELATLAARVFSKQLRRDRPLWEMWLVDGLEGDRFAVISKTHHALVDGISGLDILSVLFAPDEAAREAEPWRPERQPSGVELMAEAVWERATAPLGLVRPALGLVRHPERVAGGALAAVGGLGAMAAAALLPAPRTPYNRPVRSGDRLVAWARVGLDEVKAVKNELGGTVNDVVLAAVTRALRRDLERRGQDPRETRLRAFVPVSVRTEDERGRLGNRVTGMVVTLPLACEQPTACLQQISDDMRDIKSSGQAIGAQALTELAGFAPPTLLDQASRLAVGQRFVNLVVTNVPGPQQPLYMDGRELLEILPMVPIGKNLALNIAIVSYNGRLAFGLVGDFDAVPEVDRLAEDLQEAVEELTSAAGVEREATAPAEVADAAPAEPLEPEPQPEPEPEPEPEPAHVDTPTELVSESAEPGAQEGAGPELHVSEPWPGYDAMSAADVIDRLPNCTPEQLAVVSLYERNRRERRSVIQATERALTRASSPAGRVS